MKNKKRALYIAGFALHVLVAGLMIFAGSGKLFGFAPKEVVEGMQKYGLGEQLRLIGGGEMLAALGLLIPRTASLGVLATSGFWGGVICLHMSHGESYTLGVVMLLLTWLGAYLRYPEMFISFFPSAAKEAKAVSSAQ